MHRRFFYIEEITSQKSCIGHVISNIQSDKGELLHWDISNHNTAQLLKISVKQKDTWSAYFIMRRDYSLGNIRKFKECLFKLSFDEVYMQNNMNLAFGILMNYLYYSINCVFLKLKLKYLIKPKE